MAGENEPPREAVKQSDGSYISQNGDGTTNRHTRRPDGTWRKPERTRAGFVGELEQTKYVSKGAAIEDQRQAQMMKELGRVPGAPPGAPAGSGAASATADATQASKRNERKKEKRQEKQAEQEEARVAGYPAGKAEPPRKAEAVTEKETSPEESAAKNEKAIRKKLRQLAELEDKQSQGEVLNEDQQAKVANKASLEDELKAVLAGELSPPVSKPVPVAAPATAAVPVVAPAAAAAPVAAPVASVPEPAAAPKNRKGIEKKLRQIAEIEEREKAGEVLNDDQKSKVASKKQLEAELKAC